jgi:hypothetical protein
MISFGSKNRCIYILVATNFCLFYKIGGASENFKNPCRVPFIRRHRAVRLLSNFLKSISWPSPFKQSSLYQAALQCKILPRIEITMKDKRKRIAKNPPEFYSGLLLCRLPGVAGNCLCCTKCTYIYGTSVIYIHSPLNILPPSTVIDWTWYIFFWNWLTSRWRQSDFMWNDMDRCPTHTTCTVDIY